MARLASGSAAAGLDLPGAASLAGGGVSPGGGAGGPWGAPVDSVKASISSPNTPASGAGDASIVGGVPPAGGVAFGPT
jgi:hypothetical protein